MDLTEVVMNSARQRILQFLLAQGDATPGQMAEKMKDIPRPSLYRHLRILLDANVIEVSQEKRIRGAVEKTYRVKKNLTGNGKESEDTPKLINSALLSLTASFTHYFADPQADPVKDLLSVSFSTLMLSDEEMIGLLKQVGELLNAHMTNEPLENRKTRRLAFISYPDTKPKKGEESQ
ncbi:MAG: helix-turn-helix domain-containing protein [Eubacteriales bacterium]|nr:helix-turn-helix domain-containing protein [Eubacteriales bacterium]